MPYTQGNIEEWDFRHCTPGDPEYDAEADLFLSENYTTVIAIDAMRLNMIASLVDDRFAVKTDDGEHVRFTFPAADDFLKGMKSAHSRFTTEGRTYRRIIEALRRENAKSGSLRISLLSLHEKDED